MSDQELLTYAAKAAGYSNPTWDDDIWLHDESKELHQWNPLENDADAFRLAVDAHIDAHTQISDNQVFAQAELNGIKFLSKINGNKYRALRRCITQAAAEIGKAKQ